MEQTTIESRVASAILERNVGNIEIEGVTYEIAPPSIATLIVVSEFIASLPIVEKVEKTEIVNSVLHHARFFRPLGDAYPRSEEPHRGARRRAGETLFVRSHQAQEQEENQDRQTGGTRQSHFRERPSDGSVQRRRTTASRHGDQQFFRHYHFPVRGEYPQTDKGSGKRLNDSIWATVLGIARTLGVTEKYALYDISYVNAIMYSRAMPMPGDKGENGNAPLYDGSKDANNPENFTDFTDDEEIVRI